MTGRRWLLAAVVAGLVALLAVGLVGFESPALGRAVTERLRESTGLKIEVERFRFAPLRGLTLDGVTARGRLEDGRLDFAARRVALAHRLLPLLTGRVALRQATLDEPDVRWTRPAERPALARRQRPAAGGRAAGGGRRAAAAEPASALAEPGSGRLRADSVAIEGLRIQGGRLTVTDAGAAGPELQIAGLDLRLRGLRFEESADSSASGPPATGTAPAGPPARPSLAGLSGHGRFSAAEVIAGRTHTTEVGGRLELDAGRLTVTEGTLVHPAGPVEIAALEVDLRRQPPPYAVRLNGRSLDAAILLEAPPGDELGRADLEFEGSGAGDQLTGRGTLQLEGGRLPAHPILTALDGLLGGSPLVGAALDPTLVRFEVDPAVLRLEPFRLAAGGAALDIEGEVRPGGELAREARLSAPRDHPVFEGLPADVLDRLTGPDDRLALPVRIGGTRERPRLSADLPELAGQEKRRLRKALEQKLKDRLRDLLERVASEAEDGEPPEQQEQGKQEEASDGG